MTIPASRAHELVLAVHPTTRGFGWILFENPHSPADWGSASAKQGRKSKLLARFERILRRFKPDTLVLEEFEGSTIRRGTRAQDLCRAMLHAAQVAGLDTRVYPRDAIQASFAPLGATTRFEIAQAIAQQIEALRPRLPRERKAWMPEGHTQSLFDAAALALTHFAMTGTG